MGILGTTKTVRFTAAEDLDDCEYRMVTIAADNAVSAPTNPQQALLGVIYNAPKASNSAEVAVAGRVSVLAGATVSAGDWVGAMTSEEDRGKAVAVSLSQNSSSGNFVSVLGICTKGGSAGEHIELLIAGQKVLSS